MEWQRKQSFENLVSSRSLPLDFFFFPLTVEGLLCLWLIFLCTYLEPGRLNRAELLRHATVNFKVVPAAAAAAAIQLC